MSILVWAVMIFSCASRLAYGRGTCQLGPVGLSPIGSYIGIYLSCSNDIICCAQNQVTGSVAFDSDPTLTPSDGFGGGSLCPDDYPQPCCCIEDEFTAPPSIGACTTYSPYYYAYSSVQCGTDQYKLCCDAPTWTAGNSEQHAAVPPKSLGSCTTDWSYPCCCDAADPSSSSSLTSTASIPSPAPIEATLTPGLPSVATPLTSALGAGPALGPRLALTPEPALDSFEALGPDLALEPSPGIAPAAPSADAARRQTSPVATRSPMGRALPTPRAPTSRAPPAPRAPIGRAPRTPRAPSAPRTKPRGV